MVPALPELRVRRGRGRTGTPPPVFHQMALNGLMGTVSPDLIGGGGPGRGVGEAKEAFFEEGT